MSWIMRCLAVAHFVWGGLLLLVTTYFGFVVLAAFLWVTSSNFWDNFWAMLRQSWPLIANFLLLPGLLGVWMILLGLWVWTMRPRLRRALLLTHGLLLLPGILAVLLGVVATDAATRSMAKGGGIMSPLATVPLLFGLPVVTLALCSILAALTLPSLRRTRTR